MAASKMTSRHDASAGEVLALVRIAQENPWWQFTAEDIAKMMNLSSNAVAMLKRADGSPFSGELTRPERVAKFFELHPGWKPSQER